MSPASACGVLNSFCCCAQWYFVAVAFCFVPFMAVANSYGAGLTDQDNSSMYGKLCIFIFAAWAGTSGQGAIAGLGICGVVLSATSQAASLMQVIILRLNQTAQRA